MIKIETVIQEEKEYLLKRRQSLSQSDYINDHVDEQINDIIGIASSGGGIRSAVTNLGFIEVLIRCGIFQKIDYHSSVSGGGYASMYIQAEGRNATSFDKLFNKNRVRDLADISSDFLELSTLTGFFRTILIFALNLLFSLISPALIIFFIYFYCKVFFKPIGSFNYPVIVENYLLFIKYLILSIPILYFLTSVFFSNNFTKSKTILTIAYWTVFLLMLSFVFFIIFHLSYSIVTFNLNNVVFELGAILFIIGIGFTNIPLLFGLGKYYQFQLSNAFLRFSDGYANLKLGQMSIDSEKFNWANCAPPFPIYNSCVTIFYPKHVNIGNNGIMKDYFQLTPLYCGSEETGYVKANKDNEYGKMPLYKAVGISGAALSPGMSNSNNKLNNFFITLLNLNLGQWCRHPANEAFPTWKPLCYLIHLFSKQPFKNSMVHLSDGGHIENLGVFELLRRKCKLIICLDAGEDPNYEFHDLKNLMRRSVLELEASITFRDGQNPLNTIRPGINNFSERRYSVADVIYKNNEASGIFVYVKSSLTEKSSNFELTGEYYNDVQTQIHIRRDLKFPHDPTANQTFSKIQWQAYRRLGKSLVGDMLGVDKSNRLIFEIEKRKLQVNRHDLIGYFESTNNESSFIEFLSSNQRINKVD